MHTGHVIILSAVLTACGARTSIGGNGGAGESSGSGSSVVSSSATGMLCAPDGIRLCKDPECIIPQGACPGLGCTPSADRETGTHEDAGVCWNDVPNFLTESCTTCKDGDVCVHRSPTELFCVPFDVCDALYKLGATHACRYADKTPFTDASLKEGGACPPGMKNVLCGGGCGACGMPHPWACVGRSATRPFGVCVAASLIHDPPLPCSFDAAGKPINPCIGGTLCGVFDNPAPDDVAAERFGVCMPGPDCLAASKGTALKCLDASGTNYGS